MLPVLPIAAFICGVLMLVKKEWATYLSAGWLLLYFLVWAIAGIR